jgi:hypothetical protein
MEFKYDSGGLAKGGDVTLYYDGETVGKGRVQRSQPIGYSADEACDVGSDNRLAGFPGLRPEQERFHWRHRMGADRPRGCRPENPPKSP